MPSVVHGLPEQMDFGVHYNFLSVGTFLDTL